MLSQGKVADKGPKEADNERDNLDRDEDYLIHNKDNDDHGYLMGIFGNPGLMKKEISSLKQQMLDILREFD